MKVFGLHLHGIRNLVFMSKGLFILFFFIVPVQLRAQILPKEGSRLNYRLIGFSFPAEAGANSYKIEIATGYYNKADSFKKKIIRSVDSKSNKIIAEVPAFGSQYTWRIISSGKKAVVENNTLYHFSTQMNPHVDTTKLRLRILQPAEQQYKDDYVAVDAGGVLYDMNGQAVWFITDTNGFGGNVANLEFTPQGTVTFICMTAYEINFNGDILWKTPNKGVISGDTAHSELYHHEFRKLSNGHYMILGMELLLCKSVVSKDSSYIIFSDDKDKTERNGYKLGKFGGIVEYDEKGNAIWSWKTSKYLMESDFAYYNPTDSNKKFDAHDNAFFFDEKNKVIYMGFRNLNRIIKIEYPSGKILRTYGEIFKPGVKGTGAGLFCGQHNIGMTEDGYLLCFNNNSCLPDALPTVVMMQEPVSLSDTLKKVWEFNCTVEGKFNKNFAMGGNAIELPDRSLFVNMGSKYSKLFIVDREKKVFWSALPERYIETEKRWVPIYEYRANIISRKDLERLIWNAQTLRSSQ